MNASIHSCAALVMAVVLAGPAAAGQGAPDRARVYDGPLHLDQRYGHDHYYPAPGFAFRRLPAGAIGISHTGVSWYFHGGVWFRPGARGFVVAVPPAGIVVPSLPPAYVWLWRDGVPYYYANGVYYAAAPGGFVVAPAPPVVTLAPVVAPTFIIYPRLGQGGAQAEADRTACNDWAAAQPGAGAAASVFQRAFAACMDGRGYSVR